MNPEFWSDKRVLLTGHTGFKGSWMTILLRKLGSEVVGVSLPDLPPNSFLSNAEVAGFCDDRRCDIRDLNRLADTLRAERIDTVIHMAAEPIVLQSYERPIETFCTNTMGTAHVLEVARSLNEIKSILVVTTDKVYRQRSDQHRFVESDALGGLDPYSASKAAAEMIVDAYRHSYFNNLRVRIGSVRAGNVIGGGDWGEGRLVPDAVRAWRARKPLVIRNPESVRPWQHVLDVTSGYLRAVEGMESNKAKSNVWNIGPPNSREPECVMDIVPLLKRHLDGLEVTVDRQQSSINRESLYLALDVATAEEDLSHTTLLTTEESVSWAASWYLDVNEGEPAAEVTSKQIDAYLDRCRSR